jgi:hypothetical protein
MSLESDSGMILTGDNRRIRRKTYPIATLPTTNPTWIDPGANPGLCGERPATNDLGHDTALHISATCPQVSYLCPPLNVEQLQDNLICSLTE